MRTSDRRSEPTEAHGLSGQGGGKGIDQRERVVSEPQASETSSKKLRSEPIEYPGLSISRGEFEGAGGHGIGAFGSFLSSSAIRTSGMEP